MESYKTCENCKYNHSRVIDEPCKTCVKQEGRIKWERTLGVNKIAQVRIGIRGKQDKARQGRKQGRKEETANER